MDETDPVPPSHDGHNRSLEDIELADLIARARDARDAAGELAASAGDTVRFAGAVVRRQLEEHPVATLGVAAGVGFVLAGGLASPAAKTLVKTGARIAVGVALRQLVVQARKRRGDGEGEGEESLPFL